MKKCALVFVLSFAGLLGFSQIQPKPSEIKKAIRDEDSTLIAKWLFNGMNINQVLDKKNLTPLSYSIWHARLPMVEFLYHHGADCNQREKKSPTIMAAALSNNYYGFVEEMILSGCDVDLAGNSGFPLIRDIIWDNQRRFDLETRNHLLFLALERTRDINFICDCCKNMSNLGLAIKWRADISSVEMFLKKGINADVQDANGNTALHNAVIRGEPEIVQLLLNYNANPELINNKGETPLQLAVRKKRYEIVRILKKE